MVMNISFGLSGCCFLVAARWGCQLSIMIGAAVASSSSRVKQVYIGHISTIINALSTSFSILLMFSHIMVNGGKHRYRYFPKMCSCNQ